MDENEVQEQDILKETTEESDRIQRVLRIQEQTKKNREAEDILLERMLAEQKIVDNLNRKVDNNLQKTKLTQKYNKELEETIQTQIYEMHGISEDKLEGIRQSRRAYYQGCAFSLFMLSIVLVVICGVLHSFQSELTVFMAFFTAVEAALLTTEKRRGIIINLFCQGAYLVLFPCMMILFVCYELHYPEYELFLPIFCVAGLVMLLIGVSSYFIYDPYQEDKKKIKRAEDRIREIQRDAQKEIKKNQKQKESDEKRQQKRQLRLNKKEEKKQKHLERKAEGGFWFFTKKKKEPLELEGTAEIKGEISTEIAESTLEQSDSHDKHGRCR